MDERQPIPPNPRRWRPNPDPASIIIPGLDTTASTHDQIEQIEQLITFKLQNIDENFAKIQHLLATRLLPAVKKFGSGIVPVRDAANFWTAFYEHAADICIPAPDSTLADISSSAQQTTPTSSHIEQSQSQSHLQVTPSQSEVHELSNSGTDSLFSPGQAAFSSTPATERVTKTEDSFATQKSNESAWIASMESPLLRLDRDIQEFSREAEEENSLSHSSTPRQVPRLSEAEATPNAKQQLSDEHFSHSKEKANETNRPLLHDVLIRNLHSVEKESSPATISPLKLKGKSKTPISVVKKYNPYLPAGTNPDQWNGLVDLRDPAIRTPERSRKKRNHQTFGTHARDSAEDSDDSFEGLPAGMSPPVLISPARPPRSSAELGLLEVTRTPKADISARIKRDLLKDMHTNRGFESSMSTVLSPPSLSRYNRSNDTSGSIVMDTSLEGMLRRVGAEIPSSSKISSSMNADSYQVGTTPALRLRSQESNKANARLSTTQTFDPASEGPFMPANAQAEINVESNSYDLDDDSPDEVNNTAYPSEAFLMASSQPSGGSDNFYDDSLMSDDSGNSLDEDGVNIPFAHPIPDNEYDDDSSYDDDMYEGGPPEDETLFGVPPAQRLRAEAERLEMV